jgi:hypothetical protein
MSKSKPDMTCPKCCGSGSELAKCSLCGGKGCGYCNNQGERYTLCGACNGTGKMK